MSTVVQYPCSQFDYLTSGRTETESQELFEAWMAAHHPALLDMDATMPRWETASYAPFNLQQDIVIVPSCCESFWSGDWEKQTADCTVIRNAGHRDDIVQQILTARNQPAHSFDDEFVTDCYALAAARFLASQLHRQSPYRQKPDEARIKESMENALKAVKLNEPGGKQNALQGAFDEIAMSKDNYYPMQNYFIELTLAAQTTVGEPLRQLLQDSEQINLFMPSAVLETLPETHPDTFAELKSAIEKNKIRFIADDTEPQSLTLLPILDVADHILAGLSVYRELLNVSPKVYGRLNTGLTPALPQLLKLAEMTSAIHFAPLAGWKIKENEQSKIVWQGSDSTSVDALVRYPIDASKFLGFFEFADRFGLQNSQDSVQTSVFALFPGQRSGWLDILRRITRFTTALGKFVSIDEYFSNTVYSGELQRFGYEKYPVNALMEPDENPISQWNELYRKNTERLVQSSLETLLKLLKRPDSGEPLVQQFVEAIVCSGRKSAGEETVTE